LDLRGARYSGSVGTMLAEENSSTSSRRHLLHFWCHEKITESAILSSVKNLKAIEWLNDWALK